MDFMDFTDLILISVFNMDLDYGPIVDRLWMDLDHDLDPSGPSVYMVYLKTSSNVLHTYKQT